MALNSLYMGRSNGGNKLGGRNDNKKVGCYTDSSVHYFHLSGNTCYICAAEIQNNA